MMVYSSEKYSKTMIGIVVIYNRKRMENFPFFFVHIVHILV